MSYKKSGDIIMKTILIADDNIQIIEVLKQYALKEGYEVYTARNGLQALVNFTNVLTLPFF